MVPLPCICEREHVWLNHRENTKIQVWEEVRLTHTHTHSQYILCLHATLRCIWYHLPRCVYQHHSSSSPLMQTCCTPPLWRRDRPVQLQCKCVKLHHQLSLTISVPVWENVRHLYRPFPWKQRDIFSTSGTSALRWIHTFFSWYETYIITLSL